MFLRDYEADSSYVRVEGGVLNVFVKENVWDPICPKCGSDKTYCHGKELRKIRDLSVEGMPLVWNVTCIRYICRGCRATFFAPTQDYDRKCRLTYRLMGAVMSHKGLISLQKPPGFLRCHPARYIGFSTKILCRGQICRKL